MYQYVFLKGGIVVAILNDSRQNIEGIEFDDTQTVEMFQRVSIGDSFSEGVWTSSQTALPSNCISKLEFLNRFSITELAQIEVSSDPILRVLQRKQSLAEFIDLKDQNTIDGVGYLVSVGILAPERATVVLSDI